MAERVMKKLGRIFRIFCYKKHATWTKYVKEADNLLNYNKQESTRMHLRTDINEKN